MASPDAVPLGTLPKKLGAGGGPGAGGGGMVAVCAARPEVAETAALSKRPAAQGRILLWMECFGNLNLTQERRS
jgi:hypothetical protein